jgi:pyoverdine/dityrosine biosynthesis protein Dit1
MTLKHSTYADETLEKIFKILSKSRRKHKENSECLPDCTNCYIQFKVVSEGFIKNNRKILFILPAFPAKSPNRNKTAGSLPDLGERLSLKHLNWICQQIQSIYQPGAEIKICSDGRVFNDLLSVTDEEVSDYTHKIKDIIKQESLEHISTFHLDNYYTHLTFQEMRIKLHQDFSENIDLIAERIIGDFFSVISKMMVMSDNPEHSKRRRVCYDGFTNQAIDYLESVILSTIHQQIEVCRQKNSSSSSMISLRLFLLLHWLNFSAFRKKKEKTFIIDQIT